MAVEGALANFAILSAARRKVKADRVIPVHWTLTPENLDLLPNVDFTILMSVFHHWCYSYGADNALQMLMTLLSKTRHVLFFETAQYDETSDRYRDILPDKGAISSEEWWRDYFLSKGCPGVHTILARGRSLMAVQTNRV